MTLQPGWHSVAHVSGVQMSGQAGKSVQTKNTEGAGGAEGRPPAVHAEHGPKRVRAYLNGELVADTYAPLLVWEIPYYPTYYIAMSDIKAELIPSGTDPRTSGASPARRSRSAHGQGREPGPRRRAARRYSSSPRSPSCATTCGSSGRDE